MAKHLIVGAGPIGSATGSLLVEAGEQVVVVSRSGASPELAGVERVRADATNGAALSELASGSAVLYNCASPAYHRWASDWPPLATALLGAAETSGAVLATASNLYGYGTLTQAMTESTPLKPNSVKGEVRARMWLDALALHREGRIRATEVRSSDYLGPGAQSPIGDRVLPRLLAGKSVQVLPSADTPHTWTYTLDVARLLVAVGRDERAWGKPWHVPSNPERTQREVIDDMRRAAGLGPVRVSETPVAVLALIGLFNPTVRALREVGYQLQQPFVLDSSAAQRTFGLEPTPWQDVLTATIASYRDRATSS